MPKTFAPEQIVSARDFQRSISALLDRLDRHGSLLVLQHGKPVAVLTQPVSPQPDPTTRLSEGTGDEETAEEWRRAVAAEVACYRRTGAGDAAYDNCADRLDLLLADGPEAFLRMANPADLATTQKPQDEEER